MWSLVKRQFRWCFLWKSYNFIELVFQSIMSSMVNNNKEHKPLLQTSETQILTSWRSKLFLSSIKPTTLLVNRHQAQYPSWWGWVVVMSSFYCIAILDGVGYTTGVMLDSLLSDLGGGRAQISLVGSLQVGVYCLVGPLGGQTCNYSRMCQDLCYCSIPCISGTVNSQFCSFPEHPDVVLQRHHRSRVRPHVHPQRGRLRSVLHGQKSPRHRYLFVWQRLWNILPRSIVSVHPGELWLEVGHEDLLLPLHDRHPGGHHHGHTQVSGRPGPVQK